MTSGCGTLDREARAGLLAEAPAAALVDLAEAAIARSVPDVIGGPEVGLVVLQVREPVVGDRFNLAEVLVTQARVLHRGTEGWAMRLGDDPEATLAAAVLDAEAECEGPLAGAVVELCERTRLDLAAGAAQEWSELEPTIVAFEELDP
jgi:alpha-D-ribose 1-methylphosphonate 5-triphosphate synthase subunit PhnG